MNNAFWTNLTWSCMVCNKERPDRFISVDSRRLMSPEGVVFTVNVRYCNDCLECKANTKNHPLFKLGKEVINDEKV